MILDSLYNIKEDILDITEEMIEDLDEESNDPIIVSWSYEEAPDITYTLVISETLPIEINYHLDGVVH